MEITEEQFIELIATLALIEPSGSVNGKPILGMSGAEEAFETIQEFINKLEESK
jgi:hypothetical protein